MLLFYENYSFLYFFEDIKYTYFKVIFDIPKIGFSSLSSVIYHILEILVCNSTLSDNTFPCSLGSFFPVCGFVDRLNKYCDFALSKTRFHTDASVLLSHNNIGETYVWLSCDLLGTLAGILPTWMFLLLRRTHPPSNYIASYKPMSWEFVWLFQLFKYFSYLISGLLFNAVRLPQVFLHILCESKSQLLFLV